MTAIFTPLVSDPSGKLMIFWVLLSWHLTILSMSLYLHRHLTHRSIVLDRRISHVMRAWLWLSSATNSVLWMVAHKLHHDHSDHKGDPHSPVGKNPLTYIFQAWAGYRAVAKYKGIMAELGQSPELEDWVERRVYQPYTYVGVLVLLAIEVKIFGLWGMVIWFAQMLCVPVIGLGVINGLGHAWGTRRFNTPDNSRNAHLFSYPVLNIPLGFLTLGEDKQNNHHFRKGSAKFSSSKWWDMDWGYGYFRVLRQLRLASG